MKYTLNKFTINTPEAELIADLRRTARKLRKTTVSHKEQKLHGKYDPSTFYRRFGSWNDALKLAGLKITKIVYIPCEDLMLNLKSVWDKLRRQPGYNDMAKPLSKYDIRAYTNRWGSWNNALDAFAGWVKTGKHEKTGKRVKGKKAEEKNLSRTKQKRKNFARHISKGVRYDILKRDNYKCKLCGSSPAANPKITLHIDHIIPRSKGGETTPKNLQTLCSDCNLGKGTKSIR